MQYVKINDALYPATVNGRMTDTEWDRRASHSIERLAMDYATASALFVTGAVWSVVNQPDSYVDGSGETVIPDPEETDKSEYSVAGPITDNRDGTVTVKMGKPTALELAQADNAAMAAQLANAVTEEELNNAYTEGVNSL